MPEGPEYRGRSPEQIIFDRVYFDSVGYAFRALSWLEIVKQTRNVCSLQYAAHDARQAIEQLFFEEIVLSVGTALDRKEYDRCRGNSTKLHKILNRLNPDYARLALFTQVIMSADPQSPPLVTWDHKALMNHWSRISSYLHWAGEPAQTVECDGWIDQGIGAVERAATHIWDNNRAGLTGIMMPNKMQPEIKDCWERFRCGDIDIESIRRTGHIALPILSRRTKGQGKAQPGGSVDQDHSGHIEK